jgi:hypothetical protein
MELKEIGEISRDYIEKYMKLERSADRLLLEILIWILKILKT